jgi:hypothetical protein
VINPGLPDEYSRISTSPKPDIRIRMNSTATLIHEYEYSQFANGQARIFVIFDTCATLYLYPISGEVQIDQTGRETYSALRDDHSTLS